VRISLVKWQPLRVVITTSVLVAGGVVGLSTTASAALPPVNATPGELISVAGGSVGPGLGNGGRAVKAELDDPTGVAVDASGDVYVADTNDNMVREITPSGVISDFAGTGFPGYSGDGGPAYNAELDHPEGVAVDSSGDVFIADSGNNVIREVSAGVITTFAGDNVAGYSGDGGAPTAAELNDPTGVAVSNGGVLAIADTGNSVVRLVELVRIGFESPSGGVALGGAAAPALPGGSHPDIGSPFHLIITTVAGLGFPSDNVGDGGPSTSAGLNYPQAVAFDPSGNLDIADTGNSAVRQVSGATGDIETLAYVTYPTGLAVGPSGSVTIVDSIENQVVTWSGSGTPVAVAGNGTSGASGIDGPAVDAELNAPMGVAVDSYGDVFFTDTGNNLADEIVAARAPVFALDSPPLVATRGGAYAYRFIAVGVPEPTLTLTGAPSWLSISSTGVVAGTLPAAVTSFSYNVTASNASGSAVAGPFTVTVPVITHFAGADQPRDITLGPDGALWFTNGGNNSIGRITTAGVVTTFAKSGIDDPIGIATGPDGALWFTNYADNTIGRMTTAGVVTDYSGVGISGPFGITAGPDGALWFTNYINNTIGRVTTAGIVTDYSGIGIDKPRGITPGPDGALWFTNYVNHSIGRITTAGVVGHFASPLIDGPESIVAGPDGALWFTNFLSHSIGRVTTAGLVTRHIGTDISGPTGIAVGSDGALWFTNYSNNSIGRITILGVVKDYTGATVSNPFQIVAGPDSALWFTNKTNNSIGRISS